ncbi:MAG: ribosome recycling factor [Elusimicrobia bacterium CG1_02_37_114]|nr:MAG: ribosome recycling factor [Elusimicrobia bacterium CG1_02_37_114]
MQNLVVETEKLMKKSIEKLVGELAAIRTGRASTALVETVKVQCYNSNMPLKQIAGITTPDAKTIEIRPWDHAVIADIEKAIYQSSLGLTPVNDGKIIRLNIPPLTEERRQDLVKLTHKIAEDFRVSIRNDRRQSVEMLKKMEKDKKATEDEKFKLEDMLQKLTDQYIKKIDEISAGKEKEIMG